jgi:hypothetical protein
MQYFKNAVQFLQNAARFLKIAVRFFQITVRFFAITVQFLMGLPAFGRQKKNPNTEVLRFLIVAELGVKPPSCTQWFLTIF